MAERHASQGVGDKLYSEQEGRELAIRRLKLVDLPVTEADIERELARMALLGLRTEGVSVETAASVCGWAKQEVPF
jgi:hypothetical protein